MRRWIFLPVAFIIMVSPKPVRADAFDRYLNPILAKAPEAEGVQEVKELTPGLIADNDRVLPNITGALVIVQTNEGNFSKLLVRAARQRTADGHTAIPVLLIDRFVTYKEGEERAVQAKGQNLDLFPGFHLNLDIGQVVPPGLGGDLQLVSEGGKVFSAPLGKAKLYVVSKPLPGTEPKKGGKVEVGETFEPRYFNGSYKLYDDGRRSGTLTLKVEDNGAVTGSYYSDKDGQKYDVEGKIGTPKHSIQLTIKFPRTEEEFQGYMFTGDGRAIAGSSKMQERETGFYALRVEEE